MREGKALAAALAAMLVLLALVVAAFWFAYKFVKPAPPDEFVLATGREEGAYHAVGLRYQELLEQCPISPMRAVCQEKLQQIVVGAGV